MDGQNRQNRNNIFFILRWLCFWVQTTVVSIHFVNRYNKNDDFIQRMNTLDLKNQSSMRPSTLTFKTLSTSYVQWFGVSST